jgi:FHS family L-fucose permease-like MFS transporter
MQIALFRPAKRILSETAAFRFILILFFLWGFLTALNDILVPHFKAAFVLTYSQAVLIPLTFFSACFVFAPLAGAVAGGLGYKRAITISLLLMGFGALLFVPAANAERFSWFLVALGVLGAGVTILQAAAAPYVAFLGTPETGPARFSLALGFNSLGTMVAPLFGGWQILHGRGQMLSAELQSGSATRDQAMNSVRGPYLFLGLMLFFLAVVVVLSGLPEMRNTPSASSARAPIKSVFQHAPLLLGAVTAFLYAGAEVGIGSFLVNYLSLPAVLGVTRHEAALLVPIYWGGAVAGRFFGWHLLQRKRPETVLVSIASAACVLVVIAVLTHGLLAATAILSVGFCNALVVPIVVMLAISGLGPLTARASSVMTAANIGAGIVPFTIGVLADHIGLQHAFILTAICYGSVAFYAVRGSRGHFVRQPAIRVP